MLLSFANLPESNASSAVETSTQASTEIQTQIAVKRGTLEKIQIQTAEESQSQMVDESEILISGNTRIPSTNETPTLTVECKETQVTAETQIPSAEETRKRTVEATETQAIGVTKIPSVEKPQTQATTESTNLARDETQIQPPKETYPHTKAVEYMRTLATEGTDITFPENVETRTTEESKPSILNGKDISFYYIKKKITIVIDLVNTHTNSKSGCAFFYVAL